MSKKDKQQNSFDMLDLDIENAVCTTECTGLISSAPHTSEELAAYDDILNYSPLSADMSNAKSKSGNDNARA